MRQSILALASLAGAAAFAPTALPLPGTRATASHSGITMQQNRFTGGRGTKWDIEGADWAANGGIFGAVGDVIWAREAEVKHGRICMLAATGAIVQDLYTFPFMSKWYQGEKMWGLHEAAIKSGALWQVLFFIGLLEIPFLLKLADGTVDGTGDLGARPYLNPQPSTLSPPTATLTPILPAFILHLSPLTPQP